jgi:hypothetical protein
MLSHGSQSPLGGISTLRGKAHSINERLFLQYPEDPRFRIPWLRPSRDSAELKVTESEPSAQANELHVFVEARRKPHRIRKRDSGNLYLKSRVMNPIQSTQRSRNESIIGQLGTSSHEIMRGLGIH